MGDLIRKLRKRLSAVDVDEAVNKEDDIRKTLNKVDPDSMIPVDDITSHLKDMTAPTPSKPNQAAPKEPGKQSPSGGILQKQNPNEVIEIKEEKNEASFLD